MSENIEKRVFVRQISQYLKNGGEYCLTNKGKVLHKVVIDNNPEGSKVKERVKEVKETSGYVTETPKFVPARAMKGMNEYGCGCKREEGLHLCQKHRRI